MTASPVANKERRRDYRKSFAAFVICGIVATIGNAVFGGGVVPPFLRGTLAPSTAVGLAVGFVSVMLLIAWLGRDLLDEHEISCSAYGQAAATGVVVLGYPIWYVLWKGGLMPEPSHVTMFATLLLVSWAGYAYRKYA
jgi:hypothetical protein